MSDQTTEGDRHATDHAHAHEADGWDEVELHGNLMFQTAWKIRWKGTLWELVVPAVGPDPCCGGMSWSVMNRGNGGLDGALRYLKERLIEVLGEAHRVEQEVEHVKFAVQYRAEHPEKAGEPDYMVEKRAVEMYAAYLGLVERRDVWLDFEHRQKVDAAWKGLTDAERGGWRAAARRVCFVTDIEAWRSEEP